MINGIRQKAQKLIAGGLVTRAFSGDQSRFVKSYSSNKPHLVQPHNTWDTDVTSHVYSTRRTKYVLTLLQQHVTTTTWKVTFNFL